MKVTFAKEKEQYKNAKKIELQKRAEKKAQKDKQLFKPADNIRGRFIHRSKLF